jgi:phage anti-repressor protein
MKKFTKQFLGEVLQFNEDEVKLVMEAQRKFPELLVNEGEKIENARNLYLELGLDISHWAKWYKKNILSNEFFKENEDWWGLRTEGENLKGGRPTLDFIITIEFAKHLSMTVRNENGHKIRSYFILMEKAIKGIQGHLLIREPEKQGYKEMKQYIEKWCDINGYDKTLEIFYTREADMLNENLTGMKASELKHYIGYRDRETREHLSVDTNKAIYELQLLNCSLLMANLDFETRKNIIKTTCENKYSDLYILNK